MRILNYVQLLISLNILTCKRIFIFFNLIKNIFYRSFIVSLFATFCFKWINTCLIISVVLVYYYSNCWINMNSLFFLIVDSVILISWNIFRVPRLCLINDYFLNLLRDRFYMNSYLIIQFLKFYWQIFNIFPSKIFINWTFSLDHISDHSDQVCLSIYCLVEER